MTHRSNMNSVNGPRWDSDVAKTNDVLEKANRIPRIEVYSPPRVDAVARMWDSLPGMSLDLTTTDPDDGMPWDFRTQEKGIKRKK